MSAALYGIYRCSFLGSTLSLQELLQLLQLTPRLLAAIAIFTGVCVLTPDEWLDGMHVANLTQNYRHWFGIAFLASVSLLLSHGGEYIWQIAGEHSRRKKSQKQTLNRLHSLTEDEKQILRYYLVNQTKCNVLRDDDGVVTGLVDSGIIFRSANRGHILQGFAHTITDFAWEYLRQNPKLLNGTTAICRTDKRKSLLP